mmetsp:Transcript_102781/g.291042  ORF Transcript_102781/g.291042 Transcript_102781/m.291042 type:complete len:206 (-) Transcript_102781:226-843(-)
METLRDLLHHRRGLPLGEELLFHDAVEQLAARTQLQDEVHVLGVSESLIELEDVRVIQLLHDIDLCLQLRPVHRVRRDGLDGALCLRDLVDGLAHGPEAAFPQRLARHRVHVPDGTMPVVHQVLHGGLATGALPVHGEPVCRSTTCGGWPLAATERKHLLPELAPIVAALVEPRGQFLIFDAAIPRVHVLQQLPRSLRIAPGIRV